MGYKDINKKRAYQNEWHKKHRKKSNAQNAAYRAKVREAAKKAKVDGCAICGEMDADCLVFHHTGDKKQDVACVSGIPALLIELEKCIVLCSNCHMKLHAKEKRDLKLSASNGAAF